MAEEHVDTAHGRVFLRTGQLAGGATLVFVQRHDAQSTRAYTQPADINYPAVALALKAKVRPLQSSLWRPAAHAVPAAQGCHFALGICSVGSLKPALGVGALLVCDDFWCPSDLRRVYPDFRAHLLPGFDESMRVAVLDVVRALGYHPLPSGVYANAAGPRFETKAEIRMMADYCDVVGMTAAHECAAANEVKLPYAILSMVDNYANGVTGSQLTLTSFHDAQAANLSVLEACVGGLLRGLPQRPELQALVTAAAGASTGVGGGAGAMPAGPTEVDLLVHARWIVPGAPQPGREHEVLDRHTLVVKDGRIHNILPTAEAMGLYAPTRVVTLTEDHVLMPGFVNAHAHMGLSFMRGAADDMPLAQWLSEQIWPAEARLVDPAFVKAGTTAALAELIRSGVTTVSDMYWFPGAAAEAVEAAGVRAVLAMIVLEFPSAYASGPDDYLAKGAALRTAWAGKAGGRITWSVGPHAPYTVSDATLVKVKALADSTASPVHIHLHETAGEVLASKTGGKEGTNKHLSDSTTSPLDNLDRLGLVNSSLVAVHMTAIDDADIARLGAAGASVVHCPTSNMKLASGFCPVAKLINAGVNVALGTDSAASNNALDFMAEMKTAAVLAKGVSGDATAVPAWQAVRMATLNGAKALGLDKDIGSIEVGKKADFIAVRMAGPDCAPMYSVLSHLVYATSRSAITDVWVDGQQLLDNRRLTTISELALEVTTAHWAEKMRPGATAHSHSSCCIGEQYKRQRTE